MMSCVLVLFPPHHSRALLFVPWDKPVRKPSTDVGTLLWALWAFPFVFFIKDPVSGTLLQMRQQT